MNFMKNKSGFFFSGNRLMMRIPLINKLPADGQDLSSNQINPIDIVTEKYFAEMAAPL